MKPISLLWKFTFAFLVVAVITAGLVAVFIRVTSADRLKSLIIDQQRSALQASLLDFYKENGSWQGIGEAWPQLRYRSSPTQPVSLTPMPTLPARFGRDRRGMFGLVDVAGVVLVENDLPYLRGDTVSAEVVQQGMALKVDGKLVGTILEPPIKPGFNPEENLFLQRTAEALLYAVLGAMGVALLMGILIARTLIHPLQELTRAAHNIAHGQLEQQVVIASRDEVGQLGEAFNRMSQEVARVNLLRKQMTADIAHDLRTPLTVIGGYIESMRDGVLQPTPERLALIYMEIEGLQHLVGDLKMLSQVDAGELRLQPQRIDVQAMLDHIAATYSHRAEQQGVALTVDVAPELLEIRVDEGRMMQVFGNLLSNALRYTSAGGKIVLSGRLLDAHVLISVQDSGEGIAAEELPFIFDRFHRADQSRHAEAGETGLGLAIVKALVEAHRGTVRAESRPGEGTTIFIELPAA